METLSVREASRVDRWGRCVAAAMGLASQGGYEAVQMRAVADAAEVALGTIYRYFGSKDELLLAGLARWSADVASRILAAPIEGVGPGDRAAFALRRAAQYLDEDRRLMAALVTALASPGGSGLEYRVAIHRSMAAIIEAAIDGAVVDIEGVQRVIGHVWFSSIFTWVSGQSSVEHVAAELEHAARLLLSDAKPAVVAEAS